MKRTSVVLAVLLTIISLSSAWALPYAWVELGAEGALMARVITGDDKCPLIAIDGQTKAMALRAGKEGKDFPVTVCEATIPPGAATVSVEKIALPLPPAKATRIAVLGDTGCRLKKPHSFQACNDPQAWPFAQVSDSIAKWKPEVIIHVGDYYYREAPCPEGNQGCQGSPFGDNWQSWEADFFAPAASMLKSAPLVFLRGNHEMCSRGGKGWLRFLDPRPYGTECPDYSAPYTVTTAGLSLIILDTSFADDMEAPEDQVAQYASQLKSIDTSKLKDAWFISHKPLWGVGRNHSVKPGDEDENPFFFLNPTLQGAFHTPQGWNVLSHTSVILSGHLHLFESVYFTDEIPRQFVVGNGGVSLYNAPGKEFSGQHIDGLTVRKGTSASIFGFATMEPQKDGWTLTLRDVKGEEKESFALPAQP